MARSISKSAMHKVNSRNLGNIKQQLAKEADYLNIMQNALNQHDYLTIYKLLNPAKYNAAVGQAHATSLVAQPNLIAGFQDSLSHYLGRNLTGYLTQTFPFLYFDEYKLGKFHVFFGDWWDHKLFGSLDVINVNFQFNIKEFNKLRNKFLGATASGLSTNSSKVQQTSQQTQLSAQQKIAQRQAKKAHEAARAKANQQNNLQRFSQEQNQRDRLKLKLENRLRANDSKTGFFNSRKRKIKHDVLVKALHNLSRKDEQAFRKEMIIKNGGASTQSTSSNNNKSMPAQPPKLSTQLQAKASQTNSANNNMTKPNVQQASQPKQNTTVSVQSPEQTILQYECNSIRKYFGNLTQFSEKSRQIYHDYIMYLVQQAQDKATISATSMAISKANAKPTKTKSTKRTSTTKRTTRKRTSRKRSTRRKSTRRKSSKRKSTRRKSTRRKTSRRRK